MKRRRFLGSVTGGALIGISGSSMAAPQPLVPPLEGPLMKTPAVLMAPRTDGLEVVWAVGRLCRGWIEWKAADGSTGKAAEDAHGMVPQGNRVIRVRVSGLKPGVDYEIRAVVESGDGEKVREESPWKKFRTLDAKAASTRFTVWNDTHQWNDTIQALHQATPSADFLLWNGDTCNDWTQEDWLVPTLLHAGGQDVSAGRPMFLVWGNHDVRGKWAYQLPSLVATPNGRPFYAFRSGPVAVICLHTGEDKPDDHPSFGGRVAFDSLRKEQGEWLKEVIESPGIKDAPYRIVFCHIPLRWTKESEVDYAKGGYDAYSRRSREAWHDALVKWKAQLVISGHTHQTAYLPGNESFPYAQLVGGGPKPEAATWIEGNADGKELRLVMKNLSGKVIQETSFKPLV